MWTIIWTLTTLLRAVSSFLSGLFRQSVSDKSRVLKCFTDDDIDFCSDDGVDVPVMNFDLSDSETEYATDDPGDDLFALDKGFSALTLESNARLRQNITEV